MLVAMRRIRFVVTGRVQGVAFRATCCEAADAVGVTGFVRNRADGAVEGEAQGAADGLADCARWLAHGPPWGRVDSVAVDDVAVVGGESGFVVRR